MINGSTIIDIINQTRNKINKKNNIVVYTALFGNYDLLSPPLHSNKNVDFYCFSDHLFLIPNPWILILIKSDLNDKTRLNRLFKINPHLFFPDYEVSLYIDSNVLINCNVIDFSNQYLTDCSMILQRHNIRDCAYQEALECIRKNKDSPEIIEKQMLQYKSEGFPEHYGLSENGVLLRKHNDKNIIKLMEFWWNEVNNKSKRDQLSLQYVIWKNSFDIKYYPIPVFYRKKSKEKYGNYNFIICEHKLRNKTFFKRYLYIIRNYIQSLLK